MVTIENQGLTDEQLEAQIAEGLFNEDIAEVELPGNRLTAAGVAALLDTPIRSLQVLDLYDNQIGDEGAALLAQSEKVAGVNRLLVGNNAITSAGIATLFGPESLIVGPTWIDVSGNEVGDQGLAVILARPYLEYLEGLSLRRAGLSDDGALALAEAAARLGNLQYLDLAGNDLTEAGRQALLQSPELRNTQIVFE